MKLKWLSAVFIVILLSGCSLLEQVNGSMNYIEQATTFVNETTQFAGTIPDLVREAANDMNAKEQLTEQLESMKSRIAAFNELEAPAFAQTIHEELTRYNETLSEQINQYNEQIQNGIMEFQNNEMIQTLNNIQDTMDQLQNLAP